jgi:hypothetical protein
MFTRAYIHEEGRMVGAWFVCFDGELTCLWWWEIGKTLIIRNKRLHQEIKAFFDCWRKLNT